MVVNLPVVKCFKQTFGKYRGCNYLGIGRCYPNSWVLYTWSEFSALSLPFMFYYISWYTTKLISQVCLVFLPASKSFRNHFCSTVWSKNNLHKLGRYETMARRSRKCFVFQNLSSVQPHSFVAKFDITSKSFVTLVPKIFL